eukprot:753172-Hanusia_phi.AAC.1
MALVSKFDHRPFLAGRQVSCSAKEEEESTCPFLAEGACERASRCFLVSDTSVTRVGSPWLAGLRPMSM